MCLQPRGLLQGLLEGRCCRAVGKKHAGTITFAVAPREMLKGLNIGQGDFCSQQDLSPETCRAGNRVRFNQTKASLIMHERRHRWV